MKLTINMKRCEPVYRIQGCESHHSLNFLHDDSIGDFVSPKQLRYCNINNGEKISYVVFEFTKIETNVDIIKRIFNFYFNS